MIVTIYSHSGLVKAISLTIYCQQDHTRLKGRSQSDLEAECEKTNKADLEIISVKCGCTAGLYCAVWEGSTLVLHFIQKSKTGLSLADAAGLIRKIPDD